MKAQTNIEIGNGNIKLLFVSNTKNGKIKINEAIIEETQGLSKGRIVDPHLLKKSISQATKTLKDKSGFDVYDANITFNHHNIKTDVETVSMGIEKGRKITIDEEKLKKRLERLKKNREENNPNQLIVRADITKIVVDKEDVTENPEGKVATKSLELHITYLVVLKEVKENMKYLVEELLNPVHFEINAISLSSLLTHEEKDDGVVIVDIGKNYTLIVIWKDSKLLFVKTIPEGVSYVIKDFALKKKISKEESENIMKKYIKSENNINRKEKTALEISFNKLLAKIDSGIKEVDKKKQFPSGLILTGGGSIFPNISKLAKKKINLYTKNFNPIEISTDSKSPFQLFDATYGLVIMSNRLDEESIKKNVNIFTYLKRKVLNFFNLIASNTQ